MKKYIRLLTLCLALLFAGSIIAACDGGQDEAIRIVSKNYTEQRLMGAMLAEYLEAKGYQTRVSELGGTMLAYNALKNDDADIYVEYTGTAYGAILNESDVLNADATYSFVADVFDHEHDILWGPPLGFNNTYVLSVTAERAEELELKTTSDLIPYAQDMVIGSDAEFANRNDGYPGLLDAYDGLEFKELIAMDQNLTYNALRNGDLDVNVSFATDGRIAALNLVNLEDDVRFFPPYDAAPIYTKKALARYPDLADLLAALADRWDDEAMQGYNFLVDDTENGLAINDVAKIMLQDVGLID